MEEGEADLSVPAPPQPADSKFFNPSLSRPINIIPDSINLSRTFNTISTCTSTTTSSSSSSPPEFVRHFQAAIKRHRPLGMMQSDALPKPRRMLVPQRQVLKESNPESHLAFGAKRNKEEIPQAKLGSFVSQSNNVFVSGENQDYASITPPLEWGSTMNTHEENRKLYNTQKDQLGFTTESENNNVISSSRMEPGNLMPEVQKKVHFATESTAISHGADDRMATGMDDLLSHLDSLALTEMDWDAGSLADTSAAVNQDWQHHNSMEMDISSRSEIGTSLLARGKTGFQDQPHQFGDFLQNDMGNPMTQSSVMGSSCATSIIINPTSAPMISSTTYYLQAQVACANLGTEPTGQDEVQEDFVQPSNSSSKYAGGVLPQQSARSRSNAAIPVDVNKSSGPSKELQCVSSQECDIGKDSSRERNNSAIGDVTDVNSQPQSSKVPLLDQKLENTRSEKQERGTSGKAASTSRKKGYDPDLFFKVNGKLYQRLGKIGSGGSSEVHKVISSDCTIYALKKIKLKGRDYATAYGFCQEIEYLNRLKGKNNIIQLIDYEVTDKTLLHEVMNGSMNNKDGRVKDDGYIYMVLEYGEIDLAHMLSQKWKELDGSDTIIDENWLRFYWQQILQAVNTIHEERIVHSDLKPANFLLVRGSLKLIDFGIAKAIMSDTTNIQRDSQVGTLSYMSPEAFMCNETDANGNVIKCGRPSDIWSLGCILYQMVYGRTPFSEYKTFWAKFKVITDPNHEIVYEPVSNPWLLDLMKKCLAWDRNERWRIPQLLKHPFLVPPVPPKLSSSSDNPSCKLLQIVSELGAKDEKTMALCSQLEDVLKDPKLAVQISRDQLRKLLCKHATQCFQLQEQLANL